MKSRHSNRSIIHYLVRAAAVVTVCGFIFFGNKPDNDITPNQSAPLVSRALPKNAPLSIESVLAKPVLSRGEAGSWDSVDLLNPSVIRFKGKLFNFYSGFDGDFWHTGVATSNNGIEWTKYQDNPVLSPATG